MTSPLEISGLRKVVERDLKDAKIAGVSSDRSFACSYNAALQLGHIVLAAAGYRTNSNKPGYHKLTFEAAEAIMGTTAAVAALSAFFEVCRTKRNNLDYNVAYVISESQAIEILARALEYQTLVEDWITNNHPTLAK